MMKKDKKGEQIKTFSLGYSTSSAPPISNSCLQA